MREIFCDAEPDEQIGNEPVYQLSTFKGYTVDMRLKEFRKAIPDVALEFIPFDSPKGEQLLQELKSLAREILSLETEK
jgi:hypothetical protein